MKHGFVLNVGVTFFGCKHKPKPDPRFIPHTWPKIDCKDDDCFCCKERRRNDEHHKRMMARDKLIRELEEPHKEMREKEKK